MARPIEYVVSFRMPGKDWLATSRFFNATTGEADSVGFAESMVEIYPEYDVKVEKVERVFFSFGKKS